MSFSEASDATDQRSLRGCDSRPITPESRDVLSRCSRSRISHFAFTVDGSGSSEEIEIRACALDAVEQLVKLLRRSGRTATADELGHLLWNRGQQPFYNSRHRAPAPCSIEMNGRALTSR